MPAGWHPDAARQRAADYRVDDLTELPDDAPRVELRDGVIIVVPSPTLLHQRICTRLWAWFDENTPAAYEAAMGIGVVVDERNTYEPDVVLLRTGRDARKHLFGAEDVLLAVEVVSPGTKRRDRFEKPTGYVQAGITYYWRVEMDPLHVYAYAIGSDGTYQLATESDQLIKLDQPFDISLPLGSIGR